MSETKQRLFPAAGAVVAYRNPMMEGPAKFRMPTDAEWSAYWRRLLRAGGETAEAQLRLGGEFVAALSAAPGDIPDAEADYLIGRLIGVDWENAERNGGEVALTGRAFGGATVTHRFRMPTLAQLRKLTADRSDMSTEAEEALWAACTLCVEGYAGEPPVYHRAAAARRLAVWCDVEMIAGEEVDFFDESASTTPGEAQAAA